MQVPISFITIILIILRLIRASLLAWSIHGIQCVRTPSLVSSDTWPSHARRDTSLYFFRMHGTPSSYQEVQQCLLSLGISDVLVFVLIHPITLKTCISVPRGPNGAASPGDASRWKPSDTFWRQRWVPPSFPSDGSLFRD